MKNRIPTFMKYVAYAYLSTSHAGYLQDRNFCGKICVCQYKQLFRSPKNVLEVGAQRCFHVELAVSISTKDVQGNKRTGLDFEND